MKCDKLKAEPMIINDDYTALYYPKDSVDAAIDELKEKIDGQKWRGDEWAIAANDKEKQIVELKDENRKLKRALWLARAKNCKWAVLYFWYGYTDKPKSIRYEKAEAKCFKKAEEYE